LFAYLKGLIAEKQLAAHGSYKVILDCQGFGMDMQVSQQTFSVLPAAGEEAQIYTIFFIKESEAVLFGFAQTEEKELFLLLTSVSGIGPKIALALLSTFKSDQLCQAIVHQDTRLISQAPGVGAKVAGRLVLELKSKVEDWQEKNLAQIHVAEPNISSGIDDEVRSILAGLGYSHGEIMNAIFTVKKEQQNQNIVQDAEVLVKDCLKILGASNVAHKL
jgi:holliday junction DNA helicase RuvA